MKIDSIILIAVFVLFFSAILLIVYFVPVIFTRIKAKKYGLNLSIAQTKVLVRNHAVKSGFLENVNTIWNIEYVSIEKLINHYHAGGNFINIIKGMNELKRQNKSIDFQILSVLDLAGMDLEIEIEKAKGNINIMTLNNNNNR